MTHLFDEIANLRAALRWATAQPTADLTADLLRGLVWFWIPQGLFSEGRTWIEAALAQADTQPDGRAKAIIHDVAGWFRIFSGDYEAAMTNCEAAHTLYAVHGTAHEQGRAKATYGITLAASGQIPAGPEMIIASLEAAKANEDAEGVAIALVALGEGARYGGDFAAAEECYHEALSILETLGNTWWPGESSEPGANPPERGALGRRRRFVGQDLQGCRRERLPLGDPALPHGHRRSGRCPRSPCRRGEVVGRDPLASEARRRCLRAQRRS